MISSCPVCDTADVESILVLPGLPVSVNAQVRPEDAPGVPRGDIDLTVCHQCSHMYNAAYDEALMKYDATYENTLHYSPLFQSFAEQLARDLVDRHGLVGGRVAELGSGPGHFLSLLCEAGAGEGLGWDPSYSPERLGAPDHPAVRISTDRFPSDNSLVVDMALSQHVLEHLLDPVTALSAQRSSVRSNGGSVYTEVPNGDLIIDQRAVWDLVYEHVSYFVGPSLALCCRRAGLQVTDTGTSFGDQFLWCTATPVDSDGPQGEGYVDSTIVAAGVERARAFGADSWRRIEAAREAFAESSGRGPVALWGAGSKGVTYLNLVAGTCDVAGVIDINPRKHGWGVPGTDLVICGPEVLKGIQPLTVVVANPIYSAEIDAQLRALGIDATLEPMWDAT